MSDPCIWPFRPGLVGGHCIGVDPYYLTHRAQQVGYHPEMILAGRRLNDNMGAYVAGQRPWGKPEHVLYDLKYVLDKQQVDLRL